MSGQRTLFFLGHTDALVRSQGTNHETDYCSELRVHRNDALVAESCPQRDVNRLRGDWLHGGSGNAPQMGQTPSRFSQSSDPGLFRPIFASGLRFRSQWATCWDAGPGPNAHRQNCYMEACPQHAHESTSWHRLRELLARSASATNLENVWPDQ